MHVFNHVALPPLVNIIPTEVTVKNGGRVLFNCSATGVGAKDFKFQWLFNSYPSIPVGEDTSVLVISSVSEDNMGSYACEVTNSFGGSGQSEMAKLYLGIYIQIDLWLVHMRYYMFLHVFC